MLWLRGFQCSPLTPQWLLLPHSTLWAGAGCEEPQLPATALHAHAAVAALNSAGNSNTISSYWDPACLRHANHSGGRRASMRHCNYNWVLTSLIQEAACCRTFIQHSQTFQDYLFEAYLCFSRLILTKNIFLVHFLHLVPDSPGRTQFIPTPSSLPFLHNLTKSTEKRRTLKHVLPLSLLISILGSSVSN